MKQVTLYSATGKSSTSKVTLPEELFGQKVNTQLLAQAYHVYETRTHKGTHKTKTRGKIRGTTAKMYRQKGTGRARHGTKKAPIFVGGGIAFGPTGVKRVRVLPQKIARAALASALSDKFAGGSIMVVDPHVDGKTKSARELLKNLGIVGRALVLHGGEELFARALHNVPGITAISARLTNARAVIAHPKIVVTKKGIDLLEKTFVKKSTVKK
ncbi:50S ribosomal protein L4 [Candidatus Microgenomates bacterium]|nr:50S ribosomal protein L4 [Candidatus Microgenomates bacterium]